MGIGIYIPMTASDTIPLRDIPDYPCVHLDKNTLDFPGDKSAFISLYNRIDTVLMTQEGQISVLHIGGSHVQAGMFGNRMRDNLCYLTGGSRCGKGMLFPFKAMKTNAPANYKMTTNGNWDKARCVDRNITCRLGITGAAISTRDTLASIYFNMNPNDSINDWRYDRLTLLMTDSLNCVTPLLVCGSDTIQPELHFDDIFQYQLPYEAVDGTILFNGIENNIATVRGVFPENSRMGFVYNEAGINGASVSSWLKCELLEHDLSLICPDLVVFAIGINDANVAPAKFDANVFKENYRKIINCITQINPDCAFIFVTNNDCRLNVRRYRRKYNPNTIKVEKAFMELAEEYNGALWNLFRIMGGPKSANAWVRANLMQNDRIHFTRSGYELLGDLLYNAFLTDYYNYNGNNK